MYSTSRRLLLTITKAQSFTKTATKTTNTFDNKNTLYNNSFFTRNITSSVVRMGVHNIANKAEFSAALKEHNIVVVDAFAVWCGPCKIVAPHVVKFSEEFPSVHFTKIDVDDVPDVAQELGIRVMPTFMIFKGEEKIGEVVGANPKALQAAIQKVVDAEKSEKSEKVEKVEKVTGGSEL